MWGREKIKKTFELKKAINVSKLGDGFVLSKDGAITIGFKVQLLPLNCAASGDFLKDDSTEPGRQLNMILQRAIVGLNVGSIFHQQDIIFYNKHNSLPNNDEYLNLSVRRAYGERAVLDNVTYFFITVKDILFQNNSLKLNDAAFTRFTDNINQFKATINIFEPKQMTDVDWIEYYKSFFSFDFTQTENKIFNDIDFNEGKAGPYNLRGYSFVGDICTPVLAPRIQNNARSTPDNIRFNSWVFPILWDVPCYKVVNNIIVREDSKIIRGEVRDFESKLGLLKRLNPGTMEAAAEYGNCTEDDMNTPVRHHFNVFFFIPGTKPQEIQMVESFIDRALTKLETNPNRLTVDLETTFLRTVGGCVSALTVPNQLGYAFNDEAIACSNLEGAYKQNENGLILADTKGFPVVVDVLFIPKQQDIISNNNWLIFGPPGSGKSVFTNLFISSYIPQDVLFFIIDIGGSYKRLAGLYGDKAQYIELDPEGKNLSFNPFLIEMIDPENDPEHKLDEDIEILIELIFIAWNPNDDLPIRNQNSIESLRNLFFDFYSERYKNGTQHVNFDSFYAFVLEKSKKKIKFLDTESFLHVMNKYLSKKQYGYLFNAKKNIFNYEGKSMIVFELEKINEQSKSIFRLITFMLINMATDIINNAPNRLKFLWLDEAWTFLGDAEFGVFIKSQFKKIRKKGGGIGLITQEPVDIVKSAHGENIISSSNSFAYLSHQGKENQLFEHRAALSLSRENIELIISIKTENREVAIIQGGVGRLFKVQLSDEQLIVFNTSKETVRERDRLIEQNGGNTQLGVQEYVSQVIKKKKSN